MGGEANGKGKLAMPRREDETYRNVYPHPPNCTCSECTQRRLKTSKNASRTGVCPICRRKSLFYNSHSGQYECLNLRCKATGRTLSEIRRTRPIFPRRISLPPLQAIRKWTPRRLWWYIPLTIRKLFLNLLVIAGFGLAVWTGYILFTHQTTPVKGTIIFLVAVGFSIWVISVIRSRRYRYTKPSFKLVFWSLVGIFLVCAFAGIEPMSSIKDGGIAWVGEKWETVTSGITTPTSSTPTTEEVKPPEVKVPEVTTPPLRNPTWEELVAFLWNDSTDQLAYIYPTFVCEDFARTLQSNAKKAGWRCALLSVYLEGYPDWFNYGIPSNTGHGLNAFETTDRGLVYIDCTGLPVNTPNPGNCDKTVDVAVGKHYLPISIFPSYQYIPFI